MTGDRFIPLDRVDLPFPSSREQLRSYGVTTVEDLVGLLGADPDAVRDLLGVDTLQLDRLKTEALALLDPQTQEALNEQRGKRYPLGALDPRGRTET